ncbi:MAG: hypothetical protein GY679_01620 [Mycoplasma sp.]|nr:hypothetical protein [Mycoplasma sp.]
MRDVVLAQKLKEQYEHIYKFENEILGKKFFESNVNNFYGEKISNNIVRCCCEINSIFYEIMVYGDAIERLHFWSGGRSFYFVNIKKTEWININQKENKWAIILKKIIKMT